MPAVRTPEAPRDTRHLRVPGFCLPLGITGSATPTDFDFGANTPFTFVPACTPPCLRFAVTVTGHHARLGTRLLAKLYRGDHPRPPNFMRFPRRNTPESRHSHGHHWEIHADEKGLECAILGACIPESEAIFRRTKWPEKLRRRM